MPTAPKLVAAVVFAVLALAAVRAAEPLMPEGTRFGGFAPISAGVAALVGWAVMGGLVGGGYARAAGSGMRTAVTFAVACLALFAVHAMLALSMQLRYHDPMEAVVGAFEIAADYAVRLAEPGFLGLLLGGGAAAGVIVEWSSRRWR